MCKAIFFFFYLFRMFWISVDLHPLKHLVVMRLFLSRYMIIMSFWLQECKMMLLFLEISIAFHYVVRASLCLLSTSYQLKVTISWGTQPVKMH